MRLIIYVVNFKINYDGNMISNYEWFKLIKLKGLIFSLLYGKWFVIKMDRESLDLRIIWLISL